MFLWTNVFEILVAKNDDSSLGDQERQFILLHIAQLAKLKSSNLRADSRGDELDRNIVIFGGEEMRFGLIGESPFICELERLERREVGVDIEDREVRGVLILDIQSNVRKFFLIGIS